MDNLFADFNIINSEYYEFLKSDKFLGCSRGKKK